MKSIPAVEMKTTWLNLIKIEFRASWRKLKKSNAEFFSRVDFCEKTFDLLSPELAIDNYWYYDME